MHISGFRHLPGLLSDSEQQALLRDVELVISSAPLYVPTMPRTGKPLSVRMTNCGPLGWLTDKDKGYRYEATHPATGRPWPDIPERMQQLWRTVVPEAPTPQACLINWYAPGSKLGMHRDADEAERTAPVLSVSLGDDAWFRIGGLARKDPSQRILLRSGDVVVLGGMARLAYHGVDRISPGTGSLLPQPGRINLTLRRVT